jgi:hypothetical protein
MTSVPVSPTQALARKRRKEILASHKSAKRQRITESEDEEEIYPISLTSCSTRRKEQSCNVKVIKSSTKYQNRYVPGVPMTKEEEVEWRKEARRQRNRESAANSRNKVRNRIQELEHEVVEWKTKYESLMNRIDLLERLNSSSRNLSSTPSISDAPQAIYVPSSISACSEEQSDLLVVPDCTSNHCETSSQIGQQEIIQLNLTNEVDLHVIETTSRPAESR